MYKQHYSNKHRTSGKMVIVEELHIKKLSSSEMSSGPKQFNSVLTSSI